MYSTLKSGKLSPKHTHKHDKKLSNSLTLQTSYSQKSLWKNYKNQPIPRELRRRSMSKKLRFDNFSDEEEDICIVVQEEQMEPNEIKKNKKLPHFKLIDDRGQFIGTRSRIRSQCKMCISPQRCRSVQSLKLPQVLEEKKEDDQLNRLGLSKLSQMVDHNQFNQKKVRRLSESYTDIVSRVQSVQMQYNYPSSILPEEIQQNEAQETKSVKLPNEKSMQHRLIQIKLIVDELDEKRKKKDEIPAEIESIIQEEKNQEEIDTQKLRQSLSKFESESEYLMSHRDDEESYKKINIEEVVEILKDGESSKENQSEKQNHSSQQADNI